MIHISMNFLSLVLIHTSLKLNFLMNDITHVFCIKLIIQAQSKHLPKTSSLFQNVSVKYYHIERDTFITPFQYIYILNFIFCFL